MGAGHATRCTEHRVQLAMSGMCVPRVFSFRFEFFTPWPLRGRQHYCSTGSAYATRCHSAHFLVVVLLMSPLSSRQYIAIVLFPLLRSLKWSSISQFLFTHYPFQYFGRLLGVLNVAIGVTNLGVYPLYASAKAHTFLFPNVFTTCLEAVCIAVPMYFWLSLRKA